MKQSIRNVFLIVLAAILLVSFAACTTGSDNENGDNLLQIETIKILPKAYINEPYDLWEILIPEDGVEYSATACYTEVTLNAETNEYDFVEKTLEVEDLYFTPVTLENTIVTLQAKRGKETATKIVSIGTTVRADPLDDLYKSTGILGWAEAGISKSVCNDSRYIKGENSATSLHVKFDGMDPHEWGQNFMELSNETAQRYFTDQIWSNAIVTFWVYNPMDQDIEFQLVVNDQTHPVMTDWTGEEGHYRRQFAKAGQWTQIFFSLRRMGTTHKLVNNQFSTETLNIKFRYVGFSTTQTYQFEFYLDDLDVVPGETYPEIDTTNTATNETLEQGWENMSQDTGWQGAITIYDYENVMGEGSECSLYATFDTDKGPSSPFVVLNPEMMLGTTYMSQLPDMTGGTLTSYFKFEKAYADVKVDLIKMMGKEWKFSNVLPMQLSSVGNGWYKGTLNVNDFDFGSGNNDGITRIRFTFSGISQSSKVWIDTVKFDYQQAVKVRESADQDWINLPADSGMTNATVKFSTSYKKASGSARSMQIIAPYGETGVMTVSPEYAVMEGTMSKLPNMTKGTVHAYFYFGSKTPEATMRLYNSQWKYCKDVAFTFEDVGGGWYYGSIPASLFQGYPEGDSSQIIRISILIPAGYTVYVDGLVHNPNEQYLTQLNPDDVFASGIFTANDFTGNSGCEVTTEITNNSKDAIHIWADNKTGWPTAGVSFASAIDISTYAELSLDVKALNAHKWLSIKLGYLDNNGTEQFSEVGIDFAEDDWQTVKVRLNQFRNADLTKITKILVCVNLEDSFHNGAQNQFWLDNMKLIQEADEPGVRGEAFKGGENLFILIEDADYESISFDYKLVTDGTMTLILRDATWLKYFGDFTFDANGEAIDFAGVTTEKLDDGYIHVTLVMDELNRSGVADNRDNAPESIAVFDIYTTTTADGYVDNIQAILDETEPSEPTEPEVTEPEVTEPEVTEPEITEPEGLELSFTAGAGAFLTIEPVACEAVRFDYKLESAGEMYIVLRDATWLNYFGDYAFDADGYLYSYLPGVYTEKLEDGYIRVTMILDELTRSGCVDNRDIAPESIAVFDAINWATANGHIKNIQFLTDVTDMPEEPTEPEVTEPEVTEPEATEPETTEPETTEPEVTEPEATEPVGLELSFTAGAGGALAVEEGSYDIVRFDYKLDAAGEMYVVLRDATWLNYFGDYAFNAEGFVYTDLPGVTTEKLDNGYIRVTMVLSELTRSGCVNNLDIAPQSIAVFDVLSWTTVNGDIKNIQLITKETYELDFVAGAGGALAVEEAAYKAIRFDYKLASDGQMYLILRDGTWLKYYGDFAFNNEGFMYGNLPGITTEKLDNGYIRVTIIVGELSRSGCVDNLDNAPQTIAVFDVYGWTSVDGHIENLDFLMEAPSQGSQMQQRTSAKLIFRKPEFAKLPEQKEDAE